MQRQATSSGFETFLFGFTRLFAISGAAIALVGITLLVIHIMRSGGNTHVAIADLNTSRSTTNNSVQEASAVQEAVLVIPDNVMKNLSGDNEKILQSWLDGIEGHDRKTDFLVNLSEVIADAEKSHIDVFTVINNYKTLKMAKLNQSIADQYTEIGKKVAIYFSIFAMMIFIAMMGLILVVLAVERNTRLGRDISG